MNEIFRGDSMECLDLRDLVADEVEYKGLGEGVIDKTIRYIRDSDRLMQLLDLVVGEAISACQ